MKIARIQLDRSETQSVSFFEIAASHTVEHGQLVIGGGKRWIQFDRGPQAAFHPRLSICGQFALVHRDGGKIVVSKEALRVEPDRLLVPFARSVEMALAKF